MARLQVRLGFLRVCAPSLSSPPCRLWFFPRFLGKCTRIPVSSQRRAGHDQATGWGHPAKLAGVLRTAIGPASLAGQLAVRSTRAQHLAHVESHEIVIELFALLLLSPLQRLNVLAHLVNLGLLL